MNSRKKRERDAIDTLEALVVALIDMGFPRDDILEMPLEDAVNLYKLNVQMEDK